MDSNKQKFNLDDAIQAMKGNEPTAEEAKRSQGRVFDRLQGEPGRATPDRLRTDADFDALLTPYLRGELSEAQRMLVEDRIASNGSYRKRLDAMRGNVREFAPVRRQKSRTSTVMPWAIAAGLLITTGYFAMDSIDRMMAPGGARAEIASVNGEIFKVSAAGLEKVQPGTALAEGEAVRTAKGSAAVVRLPDGSLIEMNERAELSISAAYSGSTVKLERGNIVVQAAKQKRGTLKVATRESTVSVKGTIFSVSAGLRGTQVAVVEGHVVVDQGGRQEDLLPGQTTGSEQVLKRTTVSDQISWSKDSAKYVAMLGEIDTIRKQIQSLPTPALRMDSRLMRQLPADVVVYAAIPNLTGTVADATRIFEEKLKDSPVLKEWWKTEQVDQIRTVAEKLRTLGAQIGDEIVIAAQYDAKGGIGEPMLLAEVRGASARTLLEGQIQQIATGMPLGDKVSVTDSLLRIGTGQVGSGFETSSLGATVAKSYRKGAGWILAADLEQILGKSVQKEKKAMEVTGINQLRHLLVEYQDVAGRSTTSASVTFTAPRSGIASWLALPAPMPSLDYVSPDAHVAVSAVTKDASQIANEFFAAIGGLQAHVGTIEQQLGINIMSDLFGPIGGELTLALDGPMVPVPTYLMAAEVYDASRLTQTLRRMVQAFNDKAAGTAVGTISLTEQTVNGRVFFTIQGAKIPTTLQFTYADGYVVGSNSRDAILKALQTRASGLSLPRSQRFKELLPAEAQVNASAVFYTNLGSVLKGAADAVGGSGALNSEQKKAVDQFAGSSGPVLIAAYASEDSITFASSTGFFGFGLDSLLSAGRGTPMLPELLVRALGKGPGNPGKMTQQRVQ